MSATSQLRGAAILIGVALVLVTGAYARQAETPPPPPATTAATVPVTTVPGHTTDATAGHAGQTAVPVTQVPSPAAPQHAQEQVMWALVAAYGLQWLKKSGRFPFLDDATADQIKAMWGFGVAVLTAAGVHFAVSGNVVDGGLSVTITGITLDVVKDVVWQWAAQQGWFDLVVNRNPVVTRNPA